MGGFTKRTKLNQIVFWLMFIWYFEIAGLLFVILSTPIIGAKRAFTAGLSWIYRAHKPQLVCIGESPSRVREFEGVVLSTHKGFFDFTHSHHFGDAAYMGRRMAAMIMPIGSITHRLSGMFIIIKRGSFKTDHQSLVHSLTTHLTKKKAGNPRVLVFPEGHRLNKRGLLRLRTGLIRICFDNAIPVYIAPAEGSQYLMNEPLQMVQTCQPFVINYVGTVNPKDFDDWESFYAKVDKTFRRGYDEACAKYDEVSMGRENKIREIVERQK